ncbi:MAG TPA: hypothetical protein VFT29_03095 [Gemmatimonadaceae bacterium]|nr:hypothetical protein [Gemmatimonadaceae bacterium]
MPVSFLAAHQALGYWSTRPVIEVARDGMPETVGALVIEQVVVPRAHRGSPRVRRTVLAWPENRRFFVYAEAPRLPVRVTSWEHDEQSGRLWASPGFMQVRATTTSETWQSRSGIIDIGDGTKDRDCPLDQRNERRDDSRRERVTCELVLYPVQLNGEFVTEGDVRDRMLPERDMRRHSLDFPRQSVPGVRFTTYCGEAPRARAGASDDCRGDLAFWADNGLYDPSLGVNVDEMLQFPGFYPYRKVIAGIPVPRTNSPPEDMRGPWMIRWTIFTPDGKLVERDSAMRDGPVFSKSKLLEIGGLLGGTNPGWRSRTQFLVPASLVDASAPSGLVHVLNVELAPPNQPALSP